MTYHCRFLSSSAFPEIHATFVRAFSDYALDMSYMTKAVMLSRATKNAVDFESSVGVFQGDDMVGLTLIGIDSWNGVLTAFDAGTGIVRPHRGKGLARSMFDFATPRLMGKGVKGFLLEVLQENDSAIKAYGKSGFRAVREFDCLELKPDRFQSTREPPRAVAIRRVDVAALDDFEDTLDWIPSWENSFAAVRRIPEDVLALKAEAGNVSAGILIYNVKFAWIMTLLVQPRFRRQGVGMQLLRTLIDEVGGLVDSVKMINVLSTDRATLGLAREAGFECYTRQYEMERML